MPHEAYTVYRSVIGYCRISACGSSFTGGRRGVAAARRDSPLSQRRGSPTAPQAETRSRPAGLGGGLSLAIVSHNFRGVQCFTKSVVLSASFALLAVTAWSRRRHGYALARKPCGEEKMAGQDRGPSNRLLPTLCPQARHSCSRAAIETLALQRRRTPMPTSRRRSQRRAGNTASRRMRKPSPNARASNAPRTASHRVAGRRKAAGALA